jgi:pyrroline-5-carboxylate reductase
MASLSGTTEVLARLGRIAVIGGGKMGEAIVAGLIASGTVVSSQITVANPGEAKRRHLEEAYGVACAASGELIEHPDTVILAVKPQILPTVAAALAAVHTFDPLRVISIAAGITLASLTEWFPDAFCVRAMPNTPLMVGAGMTALSVLDHDNAEEVELACALFSCMGDVSLIDESLQNAAVAVSGSGPAYFALFVDALTQAGAQLGLPESVAGEMALATMRGTGDLLAKRDLTPRELIVAVSSPGGTTVAALECMRAQGIEAIIIDGALAASRRAEELA